MATQNGSFLFLNLGSNTVGFTNSFTFSNPNSSTNPNPNPNINQNPNPNTNQNPHPNINQNSNRNRNPNPNSFFNHPVRNCTISNPTYHKELETSKNPATKSKKNSEQDSEDPEWVPERKSRRTSTSTIQKLDLKTDTFTTKTTEEETLQPKQVPVLVPVPASLHLPPPQYLVSLLTFFGWKISFKSATGEYVYQSPNGMLYNSLPKAFETFLDGNSKYKEKPWLMSSSTGTGTSLNKVGTNGLHGTNQQKCPKKDNFEKVEGSSENGKHASSTRRAPVRRRRTSTERKDGSNKEKERPKRKSQSKNETDKKVDNKQLDISSSKQPNCKDHEVPFFGKSEKRGKILSENGDRNTNTLCKESGTVLGLCAQRAKPIYQNGDLQFKQKYTQRRVNTAQYANGNIQFKDSCQSRSTLTARFRPRTETETLNRKPSESDTKLTVLSKLIDLNILTENQRVMYVSTETGTGTGSNFLTGTVTKSGILCSCCDEAVQIQEFESHAGTGNRNPWENTFRISGQTLVECLKEAWEKERKKFEGFSAKGKSVGVYDENDRSDDTCGICADGGRLICCDGCLSTFHQDCLSLKALPEGSWYCPYCRCQFCKAYGTEEHFGSGPVNSLDPLTCKQCKRNYHKNCAWRNDNSESNLFCSKSCSKLAQQLSELIGSSNHMEGNFSWTLLKIKEDLGGDMKKSLSSILEGNLKLVLGRSVLNECFLPLTDQRTGIDVLSQAIFSKGSCYNRLNYEGFHTVVLQKGEEIIAVALLRFHGTKLAEMPFIATRPKYQKQGMCHRIIKGVEQLLVLLEVEKLVVPAVPDMVNTWTKSFSFKPLEPSLQEEVKSLSLVIFAETTLLENTMFKRAPSKQEASRTSPFPLYATGFPFFSMQEIFQHSLPSQGQNGNNTGLEDSRSFFAPVKLEDSRSIFAQGPPSSEELPAFNSEVYNNISFESLLRM